MVIPREGEKVRLYIQLAEVPADETTGQKIVERGGPELVMNVRVQFESQPQSYSIWRMFRLPENALRRTRWNFLILSTGGAFTPVGRTLPFSRNILIDSNYVVGQRVASHYGRGRVLIAGDACKAGLRLTLAPFGSDDFSMA